LVGSLAWGEDYRNQTIEQIALAPENREGITVFFDGAGFETKLNKEDKFGDVKYGVRSAPLEES